MLKSWKGAHELSFHGEGGLATCSVCGASEGELLLSCPGYRLSASVREACFRGNVVDFLARRRLVEYRRRLLED